MRKMRFDALTARESTRRASSLSWFHMFLSSSASEFCWLRRFRLREAIFYSMRCVVTDASAACRLRRTRLPYPRTMRGIRMPVLLDRAVKSHLMRIQAEPVHAGLGGWWRLYKHVADGFGNSIWSRTSKEHYSLHPHKTLPTSLLGPGSRERSSLGYLGMASRPAAAARKPARGEYIETVSDKLWL